MFTIGQLVKTTQAQEYDNGIEDCGYLPKGSIGVIVEYRKGLYYVDFSDDDVWGILENELEAMESE